MTNKNTPTMDFNDDGFDFDRMIEVPSQIPVQSNEAELLAVLVEKLGIRDNID